jgi:hypothetical protein
MEENDNSEVRFEEELGVHHSPEQIDTNEVSRKFDFEVETETVFKRLAEDIYKGREAGIREPLTNAVTSVIRSANEGYLEDREEGIIVIELYDNGNSLTLTLRDNGVGITEDEVDKVVTQIGKSTTRSSTHLTGQFGMGFLATWMLAGGSDGGFIMSSNPRGVEQGPFKGIWDSNGFSKVDGDMNTVGGLDEDEYGVEFEIFVDQSIDKESLVGWIDKYAEWTRVPVLFREHEDGEVTDEEYPPKNLLDKYEEIESDEGDSASDMGYQVYGGDELTYYDIEHDAFTAVCSNLTNRHSGITRSKSLDRCVLMDVPIQTPWNSRHDLPLSTLEVRINYETPVVVDGPHEGMFVVTDAENPDSLGSNYLSRSKLTENDVVTPFPTGTRDMLQDDTGFVEWLTEKFYKIHYTNIASIVQEVDTIDQYCSLTDDEVEDFHNILDEISDSYNFTSTSVSTVKSRARTDFDPEFEKILPNLHGISVSIAPEGRSGVSKKENRDSKSVRDIVRDTWGTDKEVYMAHRVTQEPAEFVWTSEMEHYVVRLASSNQGLYKDTLGWKELNSLEFDSDLEISDSDRKKFTDNSTNVSDERVNIHVGSSYSNTVAVTAGTLKQKLQDRESIGSGEDKYLIHKVILFQRGGHNISDNKDMVGMNIGTASVGSEVYDYLKDCDRVWTADFALNHQLTVPASNGTEYNLREENLGDEAVVHIVDKETTQDFREPDIMDSVQSWLRSNTPAPDEAFYVPLTPFEYQFGNVEITYWKDYEIQTQREGRSRKNVPADSDVELYAKAVIESDGGEVEALKTVGANWTDGGKELLQSLGYL